MKSFMLCTKAIVKKCAIQLLLRKMAEASITLTFWTLLKLLSIKVTIKTRRGQKNHGRSLVVCAMQLIILIKLGTCTYTTDVLIMHVQHLLEILTNNSYWCFQLSLGYLKLSEYIPFINNSRHSFKSIRTRTWLSPKMEQHFNCKCMLNDSIWTCISVHQLVRGIVIIQLAI